MDTCIQTLKPGRRPHYMPMYKVLDPAWLYSAPQIRDFLMIHWLLSNPTSAFGAMKARARKYFPEPDQLGWGQRMNTKLWYGYRWQGFTSLESAMPENRCWVLRFWAHFDGAKKYSLAAALRDGQRTGLLDELCVAPTCTPEQRQRLCRIMLQWHGLNYGLDPDRAYAPAAWMTPSGVTAVTLDLGAFRCLQSHRSYSIEHVRALCFPCEHLCATRAQLYLLARKHQFPPKGDGLTSSKLPRWFGSRWAATATGVRSHPVELLGQEA